MRTHWDKVAADARRVLEGNRQRGVSAWAGQRYDFVCPSPTTYPFQWFWDSAFHAIALLHVDPELAKQEIRCLMQGVRPDGFIPHAFAARCVGVRDREQSRVVHVSCKVLRVTAAHKPDADHTDADLFCCALQRRPSTPSISCIRT